MNEIERKDAGDGPVVSEGGHRPSALSTGQVGTSPAAAKAGPLAPGQRWSAVRQREVALRLLRGESVELLSRELGLPTFRLEQWRRKATFTWGVSLSSVRSSAHAGASGLGVQTASRFEPIFVPVIPNQNNLTSGRRARQPHHNPACGGQGSGGRDHSCCRHLRPCGLSVHPPGSVRT